MPEQIIKEKPKKSRSKQIYKIFVCGSNQVDEECVKPKKSSKQKLNLFLKRKVYGGKEDETKWLLNEGLAESYSKLTEQNNEPNQFEIKNDKIKRSKKFGKKILKRVGKFALQSCRLMSIGIGSGFAPPHTFVPNYGVSFKRGIHDYSGDYDYATYGYHYPSTQYCSPSLFF